jgi:hypothetical protein
LIVQVNCLVLLLQPPKSLFLQEIAIQDSKAKAHIVINIILFIPIRKCLTNLRQKCIFS